MKKKAYGFKGFEYGSNTGGGVFVAYIDGGGVRIVRQGKALHNDRGVPCGTEIRSDWHDILADLDVTWGTDHSHPTTEACIIARCKASSL